MHKHTEVSTWLWVFFSHRSTVHHSLSKCCWHRIYQTLLLAQTTFEWLEYFYVHLIIINRPIIRNILPFFPCVSYVFWLTDAHEKKKTGRIDDEWFLINIAMPKLVHNCKSIKCWISCLSSNLHEVKKCRFMKICPLIIEFPISEFLCVVFADLKSIIIPTNTLIK